MPFPKTRAGTMLSPLGLNIFHFRCTSNLKKKKTSVFLKKNQVAQWGHCGSGQRERKPRSSPAFVSENSWPLYRPQKSSFSFFLLSGIRGHKYLVIIHPLKPQIQCVGVIVSNKANIKWNRSKRLQNELPNMELPIKYNEAQMLFINLHSVGPKRLIQKWDPGKDTRVKDKGLLVCLGNECLGIHHQMGSK